jgi:hypothetical protein
MAVESSFAAGGAAYGYSQTGTLEGTLFYANLGSSVGGLVASRMVACFPAGTHLKTPTGSKPIEQFVVGDEITSRDENDVAAPLVTSRVEEIFIREAFLLNLYVGGQLIQTTSEHPFYVKGFGWLPAGELKPGDEFSTSDGNWIVVERIEEAGKWATVYNLRVADFHTYFLGHCNWDFSVWAHNTYRVGSIRDQVNKLNGTVNGDVNKLMDLLLSPIKSFSIGGYAQARQALSFAKKGILDSVEFALASGRRGDLLLRGGTAVEIKSWTKWASWLPSWQESKLQNLRQQIVDYLATKGVKRLMVQFETSIPSQVTEMVDGLPADLRNRVYLRTF